MALGLGLIPTRSSYLIPWAWATNGFASVIGAVSAKLLNLHLGITTTILWALLIYLLAWLSYVMFLKDRLFKS